MSDLKSYDAMGAIEEALKRAGADLDDFQTVVSDLVLAAGAGRDPEVVRSVQRIDAIAQELARAVKALGELRRSQAGDGAVSGAVVAGLDQPQHAPSGDFDLF